MIYIYARDREICWHDVRRFCRFIAELWRARAEVAFDERNEHRRRENLKALRIYGFIECFCFPCSLNTYVVFTICNISVLLILYCFFIRLNNKNVLI